MKKSDSIYATWTSVFGTEYQAPKRSNSSKISKSKIAPFSRLSVFAAIQNLRNENEVVTSIQELCKWNVPNKGYTIPITWISFHQDTAGNEEADKVSKQATSLPFKNEVSLPSKDIMKSVTCKLFEKWKEKWHKITYMIIIEQYSSLSLKALYNKRDYVKLFRMLIGHTKPHFCYKEKLPCGVNPTTFNSKMHKIKWTT